MTRLELWTNLMVAIVVSMLVQVPAHSLDQKGKQIALVAKAAKSRAKAAKSGGNAKAAISFMRREMVDEEERLLSKVAAALPSAPGAGVNGAVPAVKPKAAQESDNTGAKDSHAVGGNLNSTGLARAPKPIQDLATSLLGAENAIAFGDQATLSEVKLGSKAYSFWSLKTDNNILRGFSKEHIGDSTSPYRYDDLIKKPTGLAVDIGGNIGDSSIPAFGENPKLQIMTFEAAPATFILLKWNLLANQIPEIDMADITTQSGKPGILAVHAAVNANGSAVQLAFAPQNSYQAHAQSDVVGWGGEIPPSINPGVPVEDIARSNKLSWATVEVPGFDIASWFKQHGSLKPVWFKIDCEGCEYDTLSACKGAGVLDSAIVVGEAHPRHMRDLSCKDRSTDKACQSAEKLMQETRKIMCHEYSFESCNRVMACDLYEPVCPILTTYPPYKL